MKMKKLRFIAFFVSLVFVMTSIQTFPMSSAVSDDEKNKIIADANAYLEKYVESGYYTPISETGNLPINIRMISLQDNNGNNLPGPEGEPYPIIVYGNPSGGWKYPNGGNGTTAPADADGAQPRNWGKTKDGKNDFNNPNFPTDFGGGANINHAIDKVGDSSNVRYMIPRTETQIFSLDDTKSENFIDPDDIIKEMIKDNRLNEFGYVIQPATPYTFGIVKFWHWAPDDEGVFQKLYFTSTLKPLAMLEPPNLSTYSLETYSNALAGDNVPVRFGVSSSVIQDLKDVTYRFKVSGGTTIEKTDTFNIDGIKDGHLGYYEFTDSFIMPNSAVTVSFEVNYGHDNPTSEGVDGDKWEDNIASYNMDILTLLDDVIIEDGGVLGYFDDPNFATPFLDYNIIERDISIPFSPTDACVATLELPRVSGAVSVSWSGNAEGIIELENKTPAYLHDFDVINNEINQGGSNNPYVVTKSPNYNAHLQRADFGDNPLGGVWKPDGDLELPSQVDRVSGYVSRPYTAVVVSGPEGNEVQTTYNGIVRASFIMPRHNLIHYITCKVYNGQEEIEPVTPPINDIVYSADALERDLSWGSKLPMNVIRLMYNQRANGDTYNETAVGGQFVRDLITQNTAKIDIAIDPGHSMADEYSPDLNAARARNYADKGEKAVFASDKGLDKIYNRLIRYGVSQSSVAGPLAPIRSGYYLNPTGTYTVTITSDVYTNDAYSSPDHVALVRKVIETFRYESDLAFINGDGDYIDIDGIQRSETRDRLLDYDSDVHHNDDMPFVSVGSPMLDVSPDYQLIASEELRHNYSETGTDQRFKGSLEGYTESGTIDSKNNYKYVEFVEDSEEIYKLTEKTIITFTINPDNAIPLYTHWALPDGDYRIRTYFDSTSIYDLTNGNLSTMGGVGVLDIFNLRIIGSLFDDPR